MILNSAIVTSVAKYGTASVIAVYLAWQMGERLPEIETAVHTTEAAVMRVENKVVEIENGQDDMVKLLRGICIISATTKEETKLCNP